MVFFCFNLKTVTTRIMWGGYNFRYSNNTLVVEIDTKTDNIGNNKNNNNIIIYLQNCKLS